MRLRGLIYCHWLWIWAILFYFNIIPISPLFSLFFAFILSTANFLFNRINDDINKYIKITISLFELFILIIIFQKRPYILYKEIPINILIFIIYLIVLYYNNLSLYKVYFDLIPKKLKKYKTLKEYIYSYT